MKDPGMGQYRRERRMSIERDGRMSIERERWKDVDVEE
jgi:hypothetical protein